MALTQKMASGTCGEKQRKHPDSPALPTKTAMFNKHMVLTRAPYHGVPELCVEHAGGSHYVVLPNSMPNLKGKALRGQELGIKAE